MSIVKYRFYGCYLLLSESAEVPKGKSYIGFTVDPCRRIRQHNGELSRGGAKKTKSGRPWRIFCIVHGFRTQVQGLQFEWAWQHPLLCKTVRSQVMAANIGGCKLSSRGRQRECRVDSNLRVLEAMLSSPTWSRMPLRVTFFNEEHRSKFRLCRETNVSIEYCQTVSLFSDSIVNRDIGIEESLLGKLSGASCAKCASAFTGKTSRVVSCPSCSSFYHAACGASCFKFCGGSLRDLIPNKGGECSVCSSEISWIDLVRSVFIYGSTASLAAVVNESESSSSSSSDEELSEEDESLRKRLFKRLGNKLIYEIY